MKKQKVIFRADGDATIGYGHISRCLAFAEVLAEEYETSFAVRSPDTHLRNLLADRVNRLIALPAEPGYHFEELRNFLNGDEIVVLDGYGFDATYQKGLKDRGNTVICIDDIPSTHFSADIIINYCGIKSDAYSREYYTQVFAGARYALLRKVFSKNQRIKKFDDALLVNMGGADPGNYTCKTLKELLDANYSGPIVVVIGAAFQYEHVLNAMIKGRSQIIVHRNLTAESMFDVMSQTSVAVLSASTVSLEFMSTGGLLFVVQTADNQRLLKNYFLEESLAFDFADFRRVISEGDLEHKLHVKTALQKKFFDGRSDERIRSIFGTLGLSMQLRFRKADASDIHKTFEWANEKGVRQFAYSPHAIPWEDHRKWFEKKIAEPRSFYYIATIGNKGVGQIRFDQNDEDADEYVISYLMAEDWRGRGLGTYLILNGIRQLLLEKQPARIIGYVMKGNVSSVRVFEKAGFIKMEQDKYPDSFKFELIF